MSFIHNDRTVIHCHLGIHNRVSNQSISSIKRLVSHSRRLGDLLTFLIAVLSFLTLIFLFPTVGNSQTPGFQVDTAHNVLFGTSMTGDGNKLMWLPSLAALRAGIAKSNSWDINVIGVGSTSFGKENTASDNYTMSWGANNSSLAQYATTWGSGNISSGIMSTTWGSGNHIRSYTTTGWGQANTAIGANATVWGLFNLAVGKSSTTWGTENKALSAYETVIGQYADTLAVSDPENWSAPDQLFVIGTGADNNNRHNAVTVFKNGIAEFKPNAASQKLTITTEGAEPTLKPSSANWGYLGTENDYFFKTYSRSFYAASMADYQTFSDRRLKSNITPMSNGLKVISSLRPVTYDLIKKDSKGKSSAPMNHYGLIAQEVEKILPGIVHTHPSGMKSVGYQAIIPFLIKGMQEQQTTLEMISEENALLRASLTEYRMRQEDLVRGMAKLERKIESLQSSNY